MASIATESAKSKVEATRPRIREAEICYGTIPIELIRPPAVRHWPDPQALTPFEFAIAAAITAAARAALTGQRHERALQAGAEQIAMEQESAARFSRDWRAAKRDRRAQQRRPQRKTMQKRDDDDGYEAPEPEIKAPQRLHTYDRHHLARFKPDKISVALRKAGKHGYTDAKRKLDKAPAPDLIVVTTSKRKLLALAGLPCNGTYYQQLETALNRLTRPVRIKPLLRRWKQRASSLQLEVNGDWLNPQFLSVPLPPPMRSATALALFLFLVSIRTGASSRKAIRYAQLCDLIGIGADLMRHRNRGLNRAITLVNKYLAGIPDAGADALYKLGTKLPAAYRPEVSERGQLIHFVAVPRLTPEQRAEAQHRAELKAEAKAKAQERAQERREQAGWEQQQQQLRLQDADDRGRQRSLAALVKEKLH